MIDVTAEVETKLVQRKNGRATPDELWHKGKRIGVVEPQGMVMDPPKHPGEPFYYLKLVPARTRGALEQRIFLLEAHELET